MKIWIDLTNSPHINFFDPFIKKWENEGHEIMITCKNLSNTLDLIRLKGWKYAKMDEHAGANLFNKIVFYIKRVYSLQKFISKEKPDVGIGQASFESPLASKIAGIPLIYMNDNEHAIANYLAFPFAKLVILPDFLRKLAIKKKWDRLFNITFYPGIKESIYLSQTFKEIHLRESNNKLKTIYYRPEPWEAHYYKGKKGYLNDLLTILAKEYVIQILPRNQDQITYFKTLNNKNIIVVAKPISIEEIVSNCDLFIGAGGTMNREIAILGIPTISTYQDKLLEVDKYLIKNGILHHTKILDKSYIDKILKNRYEYDNKILLSGNKAFELINNKVLNLGKTITY